MVSWLIGWLAGGCSLCNGLLFPIRNEFSNYLNRPDHKQEFVFQWQQSYNSIAEHLRKEDAMKIELHHRVDVSSGCI